MRSVVLVGLCLLAGASEAFAAAATGEEARRLVEVFHKYLGPPRAGEADFVRSEPVGDAYRLTIDIDQFARPLEPLGVKLDSAELSFLAEPLADGTWHVTELQLPSPLTLQMEEQKFSYRFDGVTFDGIYDPALAAFTRFDETIAGMSTDSDGPTGKGTAQYGEQHITGTGIASEAELGGVDVTVEQTVGAFSMHQSMTLPSAAGEPPQPPIEFSYGVESGRVAVDLAGLKGTKLLDLWAYVVAHIQTDAAPIDNTEIKALLTDLLPVFLQLDETGAVQALKVQTPMGEFGVQDLSGGLALSGIVSSSVLRASLKLSGPSYPQELVPPWATELVPHSLEVGVDISGLDLDASARKVIAEIDATKTPWLEDSAWEAAGQLAVPEGGVKLKLGPTSIHGPVLSLQAEGEMTLKMPAPTGSFTITATGLDAAIASLKESADPMAGQALGALTLVQAYGKAGDDGATHFQIEMKADGSVSVNGQMLKPPTEQAL